MAMENECGLIIELMKANGIKAKCKVKEQWPGQTDVNTLVHLETTKSMDMENSRTRMEIFKKASGGITSKKAKEKWF